MTIDIKRSDLTAIQSFRELFLSERSFQFVYNKCHKYNWCDDWIFSVDGVNIGYGCIWGSENRADRDAVFEFYVLPDYRKYSNKIFSGFIKTSGAICIECQTNDILLCSMLYEFAENITAESILFEEHYQSNISITDAIFRKRKDNDNMGEDDSPFVLDLKGEIIASGGLMLNYNFPFADIYMQVKEPYRRRGYGSFLVQELKKEAYLLDRVPAARCNIDNFISKATLQKAGLKVCGFLLNGKLKPGKNIPS